VDKGKAKRVKNIFTTYMVNLPENFKKRWGLVGDVIANYYEVALKTIKTKIREKNSLATTRRLVSMTPVVNESFPNRKSTAKDDQIVIPQKAN
jgi:hypothetical protein